MQLAIRNVSPIEQFVIRSRNWMSILIVLVTLSAWFAISNHCALGVPSPAQKKQQDECPFHHSSAPAKEKKSDALPCCKILRAIAAKTATKFAKAIVDLIHVDLSFAEFVVVAPPKILFAAQTLDTGPPGKTSFVELIRSMRAHAPPVSLA